MFIWRRKKRAAARITGQLRSVLIRDTMELVRIANEAEQESQREAGPENTDVREVVRITRVHDAQRAFLDHVVKCCHSGWTLSEISVEVINPIVEKSVVGDVAWYAINQAMSSANRRLNRAR